MESKTFLLFCLITITFSVADGRNHITECEEDHECGENRFCYRTGLCASCTNCGAYSRKPHEWKTCAKSPNECGECLSGYTASALTDGSEREFCVQIKPTSGSINTPGDPGQTSIWFYALLLVGVPSIILIIILLLYQKTGICRASRAEDTKVDQPIPENANIRPPPYFSNGNSPLLTRNTGGEQYQCRPAWCSDHQMGSNSSSSYHDKECDVEMNVMERTTDGLQQAKPFEYHPDELKEMKSSRVRSSCRPDEGKDNCDDDDDNEDGLSVTHDPGINASGYQNSRLPTNTEEMEVESKQIVKGAAQQGDTIYGGQCSKCVLKREAGNTEHMYGTYSSLSDTASIPDHHSSSQCSVTDLQCRYWESTYPVKSSSERNILRAFSIPLKSDSGFMSKCSSKFEELHDDSFSNENTKSTQYKSFFPDGEPININLPVSINILNTVNIGQ